MGQVCDSGGSPALQSAATRGTKEPARKRRDRSPLRRLRSLEAEVEDLRALAALGERVAGVAHDWKNAVHSLRGFTALLQGRIGADPAAAAVLDGLRGTIDQLEENARAILSSGPAPPSGPGTAVLRAARR
jgi:signal transduction histidine kinase